MLRDGIWRQAEKSSLSYAAVLRKGRRGRQPAPEGHARGQHRDKPTGAFQPCEHDAVDDGNVQRGAIRRRLGVRAKSDPLLPFLVGQGANEMRQLQLFACRDPLASGDSRVNADRVFELCGPVSRLR